MTQIEIGQNTIDSRDVVERLQALRELAVDLQQKATDIRYRIQELRASSMLTRTEVDECEALEVQAAGIWTGSDGSDYAFSLDFGEDEDNELQALKSLDESGRAAVGDAAWQSGGRGLVADSYFETYAEELAESLYQITSSQWPGTCIDWSKAADELKQDYKQISWSGVDYWIRS